MVYRMQALLKFLKVPFPVLFVGRLSLFNRDASAESEA
jgi:hypothetical protein